MDGVFARDGSSAAVPRAPCPLADFVPMDFFAQQAKVRRSSRTLVWLFALAVFAIVVAVDLVCAFVLGVGLRPAPLIGIAVAVVVVIGLCSAYRVASLAGGGAAVAREMNAVEVPADTSDPQWQRLRNVIEEVAIASGVPVPEIYVMQNEQGINAFAAGYTPTDTAVCVTQGCLDKLNRDELQGVIAHEFSHVLNGDMRLNIRLMGLLFGIMAIWVVGRFLMWGGYFGLGDDNGGGRRRGGGSSGQVALAGIALLAIGAIGVFFGRLIQAAVSRSRESLADASAVQFTRQTSGIAGALKKIAVFEEGSALQAPRKDEVRHMLFGDAEESSWFATHPPITARIKALEPGFKPEELDAYVKQWLAAGNDPDRIELRATEQPWEKAVHDFARADGDVDIDGVVPARGAELAHMRAGDFEDAGLDGFDIRGARQTRSKPRARRGERRCWHGTARGSKPCAGHQPRRKDRSRMRVRDREREVYAAAGFSALARGPSILGRKTVNSPSAGKYEQMV